MPVIKTKRTSRNLTLVRDTFQEIEDRLTSKTLNAWKIRHQVLIRGSTLKYQGSMRKFLGLVDMTAEARVDLFAATADILEWAPATRARNFSATLRGMMHVNVQPSQLDRLFHKELKMCAKMKLPESPTTPISETQVRILLTSRALSEEQKLLLAISFILGQRIGDVLRMKRQHISQIFDPLSKCHLYVITLFEGKTIKRRQPYSLHLPVASEVGQALAAYLRTAQNIMFPSRYLTTYKVIRTNMQLSDTRLNLLSIRKGGLQRMALLGMTTENILTYSRHASVETLMRYLDWGAVHLEPARQALQLHMFDMKPL